MEDDDNSAASDVQDHGIGIDTADGGAARDSPVEWGPGKTPRGRARLISSRRRTKPQRSCNLCRQRKLRCDRQHPCSNCSRRQLPASCTYPTEGEAVAAVRPRKHPATVQERVQHLEKLLIDMVEGRPGHYSPPAATPLRASPGTGATPDVRPGSPATENLVNMESPPDSDCGTMHRTSTETSYVSSVHWAAVLDDIAVLKMHFEKDEQNEAACPPLQPLPPSHAGPQLLYGCTKLACKEELLASVPPRPAVDQLIASYFSSFDMSPAFLHSLQFLHEYEEFWNCPKDATVIWLGQLFAIMCLGTQFQRYKLDGSTMSPGMSPAAQDLQLQKSAENLRSRVVQCLVLADYVKGGPGVVEALMFYLSTELFFHQDAKVGVWLLLGTIIQIAMRMGYHRDPKHFPSLKPFAGEMQRRVWATIVESDIAVSVQMGLPRIIQPSQTDTDEPLNLEDCDFSMSTTEMPPARPEISQTPMLFRLVKARFFHVLGSIWDLTIRNTPATYAEMAEMGVKLEQMYNSIPACLKWRSKTQCMADSPHAVVQKAALQIIYHVARIMMHRKYFSSTGKNIDPDHRRYSQRECLDASLKLLDFQHILNEKMVPFGQLCQERWKVSSLISHIFLLAASILCFYLKMDCANDGINGRGDDEDRAMEGHIRTALRQSHDIWVCSSGSSQEAKKAARAVGIVLGIDPGSGQSECAGGRADATATTPSFSPAASAAGSDFLATFPSSINDWARMSVPFPAIDSAAWTTWSVTQAETAEQDNTVLKSPGLAPSTTSGEPQNGIDRTYLRGPSSSLLSNDYGLTQEWGVQSF